MREGSTPLQGPCIHANPPQRPHRGKAARDFDDPDLAGYLAEMQTDVPVKPDENARAELAFSVWASDGNQNLRDTAELTGIPYRTIHYYARTRDWSSRLLAQQSPEAERGALMAETGCA